MRDYIEKLISEDTEEPEKPITRAELFVLLDGLWDEARIKEEEAESLALEAGKLARELEELRDRLDSLKVYG